MLIENDTKCPAFCIVFLLFTYEKGDTNTMDQVHNSESKKKKSNSASFKQFIQLLNATNFSKKMLILGILLSLLTTAVDLAIPLAAQTFIDGITIDLFTPAIIFGILALLFVQVLFDGFSYYLLIKVGQRVVAGLRELLWKKVIKLPVPYFDQNTSGETVSRVVNDTNIVYNLISQFLPQFISGIISIIGSVTILFLMDWQMTLVLFIVVPLMVLFMVPLGRRMSKISKELQGQTAEFSGSIQQTISESRLMKSSTAESYENDKGMEGIDQLYKTSLKEGKILAVVSPIMSLLMMGTLILIVSYGGVRVSQGMMTTGSFIAFLLYIFQLIFPMVTFANFYTQIRKTVGATERIITILNEDEEDFTSGKVMDISGLPIEFEDVYFSYSVEEKTVLSGIYFKTFPGQKIALAGPSGGGKTTLFGLIERFYTADSGQIYIGNHRVEEVAMRSWRKQIGYVSQENAMMSGTIRDNLCYGLPEDFDVSEDDLWQAAEMAYAKEFIQAFPNGLDEIIGERGIKLSGGQRQRINIARAFLRDPKILLMDEATSNLDSQSEQVVSDALKRLMENRTTFVIAHRLSTITDANLILFIEEGQVTGRGTHEELIDSHELYSKFAKQQLVE